VRGFTAGALRLSQERSKFALEQGGNAMASPLVEYCEQADPGVLADIRKLGSAGGRASQVSVQRTDANLGHRRGERRIQASFLAGLEKRALIWMAERVPAWVNSDHLTALGFAAQLGAGAFYALSRWNRFYLLAVIGCLALNWLGDSLDGTLARVRQQQRPRYGFYVDHMVDSFGAVAMMAGLALSGYMHPWIAMGLLVAFLVLSIQSYLATYTLGEFHLSFWSFGPTELRLLLAVGNLALLRWPVVLHHQYRLFDIGGVIGLAGMTLMIVYFTAKNGYRLYREERIR
jgi:archaetidylinositol phosphate synthase